MIFKRLNNSFLFEMLSQSLCKTLSWICNSVLENSSYTVKFLCFLLPTQKVDDKLLRTLKIFEWPSHPLLSHRLSEDALMSTGSLSTCQYCSFALVKTWVWPRKSHWHFVSALFGVVEGQRKLSFKMVGISTRLKL